MRCDVKCKWRNFGAGEEAETRCSPARFVIREGRRSGSTNSRMRELQKKKVAEISHPRLVASHHPSIKNERAASDQDVEQKRRMQHAAYTQLQQQGQEWTATNDNSAPAAAASTETRARLSILRGPRPAAVALRRCAFTFRPLRSLRHRFRFTGWTGNVEGWGEGVDLGDHRTRVRADGELAASDAESHSASRTQFEQHSPG